MSGDGNRGSGGDRKAVEVEDLSAAERAALFKKLRESRARSGRPDAIPRVPRGGPQPCTFDQERHWFLWSLDPTSSEFHLPNVVRMRGKLDDEALERSFREIVRRHEALRTTFVVIDGDPHQIVHDDLVAPFERVDVRKTGADAESEAAKEVTRCAATPFDLERASPIRALLVQTDDEDFRLCVTIHHIVADGTAVGLIIDELVTVYNAFRAHEPSPLPEPALQLVDFAAWQRERFAGTRLDELLAWWVDALRGAPPKLELPRDFPPPPRPGHRGVKIDASLPVGSAAALSALAREERATPFIVFVAAFAAVLSRYAGQSEVVIGSATNRRSRSELERLVASLASTLPLRVDLRGAPSFRELVRRARGTILEAFGHEDVPFDRLVAALNPTRAAGHAHVFQAMVLLQDVVGRPLDFEGLDATREARPVPVSHVDVILVLGGERDGAYEASLVYDPESFEARTAAGLVESFRALVDAALTRPDECVRSLPLMTAGQRRQVLEEWQGRRTPHSFELTTFDLFAAQAAKAPDAVAVFDPERARTRAELLRDSNAIAAWLISRGVGPGAHVAVSLERSVDMVAALLGVMIAGAAYVPIDPTYPEERRKFVRADADISIEIDGSALAEALAFQGPAPRASAAAPDRVAYVLYTSGSTGKPKGVMISHRALVSFLQAMRDELPLSASDVLVAVTTLSFDIAGLELYLPLVIGATVAIADRAAATDARALAAFLKTTKATVMQATPATWRMLLESGWSPEDLTVLCGGEALAPALAAELARGSRAAVWNLYGPTETTIWSTCARVSRGDRVTIGRPIANTRTYVVDEQLEPVPPGVVGELCIAGPGVADGYHRRPELTADRFVADPFARDGSRMYRTGDAVRWLGDGRLAYERRLDHQIKLRGFRIELGEIEAVISSSGLARNAVAKVWGDGLDGRLVAYVVPTSDAVDAVALRNAVADRLPAYMHPNAWILLDALPLTPNGKIDRKALPAPDANVSTTGHVPPRTETERIIAAIWREELKVERVGIDDDFFALGGHSLNATRVVARLRATLAIDVPLRFLFESPNVQRLAQRIDALRTQPEGGGVAITKVDRGRPLECSFAQERLWFLDQLDPGQAVYHVTLLWRLRGALDVEALAFAVSEVLLRHEALRTTFAAVDGRPKQVIHASTDVPIRTENARDASHANEHVRREMAIPFDLSRGPLVRAMLVKISDDDHAFVFTMHHIVTDGWSVDILESELQELYSAHRERRAPRLSDLPIQYADYAAWQRAWLTSDVLDEQLAYWRSELAGAPPTLDVPTDRPRPPVKSSRGGKVRLNLGPLSARVNELARREAGTPFMVLLAAFDVLLARHAGQNDVVVGVPIANRTRPEVQRVVGFFVNTLVLRTRLDGDPSFRDVVARVKRATRDAYAHQDVPFERLVEEINPPRDMSRTPVFQVMFAHMSRVGSDATLDGLTQVDPASDAESDEGVARFDLTLWIEDHDGELAASLEYDVALFDRATARRLAESYAILLDGALARPDDRIAALPLMSDAERRQVLEAWQGKTSAHAVERTTFDLFLEQAARSPNAIAVRDASRAYSYAELRAAALGVGGWLSARGIGAGARVAVSLDRDVDMVAALLGVMSTGAAYVPIDPAYPAERREFVRADADIALDLDAAALAEALASSHPTPGTSAAKSSAVAYVLYTSGSTGRPKGVEITHRALSSFLHAMRDELPISASDVLVAVTTLSFDIAGLELYLPLVVGASVVVADRDTASDGAALAAFIAKHGGTVMQATPATWRMLLEAGWRPSDLKILCGGEALPPALAGELTSGSRGAVWNLYGPTETTIWSTCARIGRGDRVTIGRPIPNTRTYVLDTSFEPVPAGVVGELCIAGPGVAEGYHGRAELTADRFVPDPFAPGGARMYRTGDAVRWLPDGRLAYERRLDHQIKLRGFRIELGEIEAVIADSGLARAAVAKVVGDALDARLVAYVVPTSDTVDVGALRSAVAERLPGFMQPSAWVLLDALPLTPNGKVDRKALPMPDARASASEYVAPRNPIEETIATIWREELRVERVGIHDDFFALGGHSLNATRVVARLRAAFAIDVPLRALFEAPALARLAERIAELRGEPASYVAAVRRVERDGQPIPASPQQEALWFLETLAPGMNLVSTAASVAGDVDDERLARCVERFAARHEVLRTTFAFDGDRIVQRIGAAAPIAVDRLDLRGATREEIAKVREEWWPTIDLENGPLWRAALVRTADRQRSIWFVAHHAIWDAGSTEVLWTEIPSLYDSGSELEELPFQYADYAKTYREHVDATAKIQLAYWTKALAGASRVQLPSDTEDVRRTPSKRGGWGHRFFIEREIADRLRERLARTKSTLFHGVLAVYAACLARWCGQREVVIAASTSGRTFAGTERLVGCFFNTLPIRIAVDRGASFDTLLMNARETALDALANGDVPFAAIVEAAAVGARRGRTAPFAEIGLTMLAGGPPAAVSGSLALEFPFTTGTFETTADVNLELFVGEATDGRLTMELVGHASVLAPSTLERIARSFTELLGAAVERPRDDVGLLPFATARDVERIHAWNATARAAGVAEHVHELLAAQAARTPEAIALELEGHDMTYRELDERSSALAAALVAEGVGPGKIVALMMRRSFEMLIAVHGVLKAGAAYAPLDPEHPPERLRFMLSDLDAELMLVEAAWSGPLPEGIRTSTVDARAAYAKTPCPRAGERDGDVAYVIYTSGSTGRPKGVMNVHSGLRNRLLWMQHAYGLAPGDVVLQKTPYTFDVSVWELIWPLMFGARLVIARPDGHKDPSYLARLIRERGVTTSHFVPSMLGAFLEEPSASDCSSLRRVICSGEALPRVLQDRFHEKLPRAELHNLYGPTEASIDVTAWQCRPEDARPNVPIGRPIWNTQMHVVDASGETCPIGVAGELCIGGVGLARGYWKRPDLTADRFVPNPFASEAGARMYRTGDLARWLPDGSLEYLGRIDHQVKIRGLRIELGEIESSLRAATGVVDAVVVARDDRFGGKQLVAYVVTRTAVDALRRELARTLPDYMVPAFVVLDALPLNASGKVDRKALPEPDFAAAAAEYAAPRTQLERQLCEIFASALSVPRVGVHDDFFALGGHSLLAARIVARLRSELGLEIAIAEFFSAPTVAGVAELQGTVSSPITPAPSDAPALPSYAQAMVLAWEDGHERSTAWSNPRHIVLSGPLDISALSAAVSDVVRCNEVLRTVFPRRGERRVAEVLPFEPIRFSPIEIDQSSLGETLTADAARPFHLDGEPLLRFALYRLSDGRHVLVYNSHQVLNDFLGEALLLREICVGYAAHASGEPSPIEPPRIQYRDYAAWDRARIDADSAGLARARARLRGSPVLELPVDHPRTGKHTTRAVFAPIRFSAPETTAIANAARREATTRAVVMLAGLATVMAAASGQRDIVIGSPSNTRLAHAQLERMIGRFTGPLLYRVQVADDPRATLAAAKESSRAALADAALPASLVLDVESPLDSPRLRVIMNVPVIERWADQQAVYAGVRFDPGGIWDNQARGELTLNVFDEPGGGLAGNVFAVADLYAPERVQRLAAQLHAAVMALTRL